LTAGPEGAGSGGSMAGSLAVRSEILPVYGLIMILSLPFWILGLVFHVDLLPGVPISGLTFLVPALSGVLYYGLARKPASIAATFRRVTGPAKRGDLLLFGLMPLLLALGYLQDGLMGGAEPFPSIDPIRTTILLLALLVAALGEEYAWTGIFLNTEGSLSRRRNALLIAILYCVWHAVPFLQTEHGIEWIMQQLLFSFFFRLLIVNLVFIGGKRGVLAVLLHASYNLAWQLYPIEGSGYRPLSAAMLTAAVLLVTEVFILRSKGGPSPTSSSPAR